jgi:O-antigen ligase
MAKPESNETRLFFLVTAAHWLSSLFAMAVMSICGALATVIGLYEWVRCKTAMKRIPVLLSLGVFVAAVTSLVVATLDPVTLGDETLVVRFSLLQKTWFLIVPFTTAILLKRVRFIAPLLKAYFKFAIVLGLFGFLQFFLGWPKFQGIPGLTYFHVVLFLGFHLTVASVWFFPTFTGLALAIESFRRKNFEWRRFAALSGGIGCVVLCLTFSRMAWIALPVALVLLALIELRGRIRVAFIGLVFGLGALLLSTQTVQNRIGWGSGKSDRFELWSMSLKLIESRPWTGVGWLHVQDASPLFLKSIYGERYKEFFWGHAHNQYLEVLAGVGIPGFLIWLCWVLWPLWALINAASDTRHSSELRALARGFAVAWVGLLLNGLTQVNLWDGKVAHGAMLAYGFSIALSQGWLRWEKDELG